jgi:hypothetical protein
MKPMQLFAQLPGAAMAGPAFLLFAIQAAAEEPEARSAAGETRLQAVRAFAGNVLICMRTSTPKNRWCF